MRTVRRHILQENFQRGVYDAHPPGMDNFIYKAQIPARKIVDNACCNCFEGEKIGRFRAKNAQRGVYGNTLPKLPIHCYHNTREVATHENPERTKDGHRVRSSKPADCKVPGSVGSDPKVRGRKQAPGRRSVQRSRGIGGEGASRVKRQCANRSICAGGRLYV